MISLNKIFSKYWRAIAWTCGYIVVMWAILRGLFNFNLFSAAHLAKLSRVELHGFPGLVFGILTLAAVPLYIATTVLTMRNKSVPFHIPLPKCFTPPPPPEPEPAPEPVVIEQEVLPELHPGIPLEMRENFMRAQKNYGARQMSVFNRPNGAIITRNDTPTVPPLATATPSVQSIDTNISDTQSTFPIPTDFDIDQGDTDDVPVFSDINFDDDDDDISVTDVETNNSDLQSYLADLGIASEALGNVLISGDFAIAVHNDDDFWVADDMDWFAAGRQKPSPIAELTAIKNENNKTPVFLIERTDIMDFEQNVQKWRDGGIIIVTSRAELVDTIKPKN